MSEKSVAKITEVTDMPLNLYQRINAVRSEVTKVGKDANVDDKYLAVTHDAVTRMVRPLMAKHGIVSCIEFGNGHMVDTGVMWGKRKLFQYQGRFSCQLINADNPEETLTSEIEAHADDNGDKAPGKALSYAMKSFYLKVFAIETGESDETRPPEDKITVTVETLSEPQLIDLQAKAEELFGADADNVLQAMAEKVFQVNGYQDIQAKHFTVALKKLQSKADGKSA